MALSSPGMDSGCSGRLPLEDSEFSVIMEFTFEVLQDFHGANRGAISRAGNPAFLLPEIWATEGHAGAWPSISGIDQGHDGARP